VSRMRSRCVLVSETELEEVMRVFLCRWPNGDVSIVGARDKAEAVALLDELGNADRAALTQMGEFLIDFSLDDTGGLNLCHIGESTYDRIMEKAYPLLWNVLTSARSPRAKGRRRTHAQMVREAVESERFRLSGRKKRLPKASTELGKRLQAEHDLAAVTANQLVDRYARKKLEESDEPKTVH